MIALNVSDIARICNGQVIRLSADHELQTLLTDSRKVSNAQAAAFFAIKGPHHDGHDHIEEIINQGVLTILIESEPRPEWQAVNLIRVDSCINTLQKLAQYKREKFERQVIGITGSNGKTIVKEWLSKMLANHYSIVKSPKSYNSQLGVPLSVWEISNEYDLAVFEAGISRQGEMARLQSVIQPSIGILTNIGTAHEEGFNSIQSKLREKLSLFKNAQVVIYHSDAELIPQEIQHLPDSVKRMSWAFDHEAKFRVKHISGSHFHFITDNTSFELRLPFTDAASIENLIHCILSMLLLQHSIPDIQSALDQLERVDMRLKLNRGINQSYVIDDSYNNDLAGLESALDFLVHQKQHAKKTLILSDLLQVSEEKQLYEALAQTLKEKGVDNLIAIGSKLKAHENIISIPTSFYPDTESFLAALPQLDLSEQVILVKGARPFRFERIVRRLVEKAHQTVLEIDLDAITHNLNYYRALLKPGVKVMVMVKAFAYGSGIAEIAQLLQFHKVHYLAVAYTDEGIALRKNGIHLPIMVMNTPDEDFDALIEYGLEPEIFSLKQLQAFVAAYSQRNETLPIHININTGMNRLGFEADEVESLAQFILQHEHTEIKSAFTHLAGADEAMHNDFSLSQLNGFKQAKATLEKALGQSITGHALNSAGIQCFPEHQFDMVRLGIGLYGLEASGTHTDKLLTVGKLKTTISQIKKIKTGDTIGYGRAGVAEQDMSLATVAIGYADGYSRAFSKGKGAMMVNGKLAPVVGNVCMDMCMINVTGLKAREGDEVLVFGESPSITDLAGQIDTIPYEILTNVSERVKRIYLAE